MDIFHQILLFLDPRELRLVNREYNQIITESQEFFFRDYGIHRSYQDWAKPMNIYVRICKYTLINMLTTRNLMVGSFLTACRLGYLDIVEYLLENGLDARSKLTVHGKATMLREISDVYGIELAIGNGHLAIVKQLMDKSNPFIKDYRCVMWAIERY